MFHRVYDELRRVAHRQLASERTSHTLSTTALVHEVYLKLSEQRTVAFDDRAQFFALAAQAMRRILVDYARRHRAIRRGGGQQRIRLDVIGPATTGSSSDQVQIAARERATELLALDEALERLSNRNERLARVVECRFFAGLTEAETAEVLGVTPRTVTRDWALARGWLYQELSEQTLHTR